jgi:hypothetical protein
VHALRRHSLPLIALALAYGCARDLSHAPTYYADVAPRIERSCLSCHAVGDGRPDLGSLDGARMHAAEMLSAVEHGRMPPGGIDRSGSCRTFVGPAPFTSDDVEVLRSWLDAGMPEGTARPPPPDLNAPSARFDRSLDLSLPLSPAVADEQRCFLVESGLAAETHLVGVEVRGAGALHHAMIFALPAGSAAEARVMDEADDAPGWSCPGTPLASSSLLFAWVPGSEVSAFPSSSGVRLQAGPLVVQLHQHGASASPDAHISLLLADAVEHELTMLPVAATDFVLAAGAARVALERSLLFSRARDALVFGVMPHLHAAGRAVSLSVEGGACLVDAPRYDFAWQEMAFYDTPIALAAGARLSLACVWDTRDRSSNLQWGESSDDEMCTVFLFVTDQSSP